MPAEVELLQAIASSEVTHVIINHSAYARHWPPFSAQRSTASAKSRLFGAKSLSKHRLVHTFYKPSNVEKDGHRQPGEHWVLHR